MYAKKKQVIVVIGKWIIYVIMLYLVISLIFSYVIHIVTVNGSSMEPTFSHGDKVFVSQLFCRPNSDDVVIISLKEQTIIKRVIATEGQTIHVSPEGKVVVDGRVIDTTLPNMLDLGILSEAPFVVPEGTVFVLGDNRNNSYDSRYFGAISVRDVYGKVLFKF